MTIEKIADRLCALRVRMNIKFGAFEFTEFDTQLALIERDLMELARDKRDKI